MSTTNLETALQEFRRNLSSEQKAEFESAATQVPTPEAVSLLTDKINEKSSTRKSRLLAGRTRVVLEAVQQYSGIVDTASSAHPIAALVWSSIKIVVKAGLNFAGNFEKLSKRLALLSTHFPRLSAYEKLFKESLRLQNALSDFYAVFVKFCTKAMEIIQEKGMKRFVKSLWNDFKSDFLQLEENMIAAKEEVDQEIQLASEEKIHRIYEQQQIEYKEAQIQHAQQLTEIEAVQSRQTLALAKTEDLRIQKIIKEEDRKRVRLRNQVMRYDYTRSQGKACRTRCQGTAVWLFERAEFKEWNEEVLPTCLWCSGITGCGKTILTGHVVEQTTKILAGKIDTAIAYYFFDSVQKESLSSCTFLRSILHQVLRTETLNPTLQRRLEAIFIGPNGSREPDFEELETLVIDLCSNTLQKVVIFIDGISEAEQEDRRLVLRFLKILQQSQAVIKLFITSRPEVDLLNFFNDGKLTHINIRAHDTQLEIDEFINSRVDKEANDGFLDVCEPAMLDKIKQALKVKARGMFLWVDLQIKAISDTCEDDRTSDRVHEVLEKLPEGIIDIYSHALQKVLQKPENLESVLKLFKWIVCARRPMSIDELHEALTITTGQKLWKEPSQRFRPSTVSKLCGNLIVFDSFDKTFSLAHHTVQAFLKSPLETPSFAEFSLQAYKADPYLGEMCVTYLNFADFQKSLVTTGDSRSLQLLNRPVLLTANMLPGLNSYRLKKWNERFGRHTGSYGFDAENQLRVVRSTAISSTVDSSFQLLKYCKTNWYYHCQTFPLENSKNVGSLVKQLLKQPSLPFSWQPWGLCDDLDPFPHWPMFTWAVHQVHIPILRIWQELVTKSEADGSWKRLWLTSGNSLFSSACAMANTTQIDLFCDNLVTVRPAIRPLEQQFEAGMIIAASLGHLAVVERLLQEKADVNTAAAIDGRTALQAAAEGGHLAVVERLLQHKADVNAVAFNYGGRTALQAAAEGGHLAVVERLLQEKADVNAAANYPGGRTALQAAAEGGHLAVVERLLQEKTDVNAAAADHAGRTALQSAAGGGHLAVVERLLQEKADVNTDAGAEGGRTALQAAAGGGHLAVVEKLLQQKADVNAAATHDGGRTALQAAAGGGHLAVVERLLQEKADVNAKAANDGRTALQAAAGGGHLAVVERLLEQKANVNAKAAANDGRTALQAAAEGGHLAVVERLLQKNADINADAASRGGRTALQAAARGGHLAVVERLLQKNADVNAHAASHDGRTALQVAADRGHLAVVERLRSAGARQSPQNFDMRIITSVRPFHDKPHALAT